MGAFMRLTNQPSLTIKDSKFFGTPSTSDIVLLTSFGTGDLVQPKWSGNAPKLSGIISVPAGNFRESWLFDCKVVDGTGTGVPNVSVVLDDATGATQINTTTNAEGRVTFGSGLLANAVVVIDHVLSGGVYSTRTRSPFTLTVNGTIREKFLWPGETSGMYEDVNTVVPLQYAGGGTTTWTEMELGSWPP